METTTTKTAKPYTGSANVAAIVGLAKRSKSVGYRPSDTWRYPTGVSVMVGGRGGFRPTDYEAPNFETEGYAHVNHKVTTIAFTGNADDAEFDRAIAGFLAELTAAGWEYIPHGKRGGLVAGPGWREYMKTAYTAALAAKAATEDRKATAIREAVEIRAILEARGLGGKYVKDYESASVTLGLADIKALIGET